jgi:hypothetical protein
MTYTVSLDIASGPVARDTDPDTSHRAGESATRDLSATCYHVYRLLRDIGPVDDETLQAYYDVRAPGLGWPPQRCVRKRRHDLVLAGMVKYTGRKVKNSVGLSVREWEAV